MLGDTVASVTAAYNTAVGAFSLYAITTASNNSVVGYSAFQNLVTGDNNIAIGYLAGTNTSGSAANVTNASNSIFIGSSAFPLGNSQTNQIVIGYGSVGLGSNTTVIGNSSTTLALIYGVHIIGGTSANAAAQLQIDSTTKGVLFPRMTTTQKNAIGTPPAGLVIYDTTLNKLCVYTTAWQTITSA
jgi:ABC-type antimicrobial peptide transport system permease subunit